MPKVSFDGEQKLITVNSGVTSLDVKVDLYSDWKEWVLQDNNSAYLAAFRSVGGDELQSNYFLSPTFFLINGWRLKPAEESHTLIVNGNIYVDGSTDNPFIDTIGSYNVRINFNTSNIVNTVVTVTGSGVTQQDKDDIIEGVTDSLTPSIDDIQTDVNALQTDIGTLLTDVDSLQIDIKSIFGLSHHNFRLYALSYDSNGNLTSGTIKLYNSAGDCASNINAFKSYTIDCEYQNGKLINYTTKEN